MDSFFVAVASLLMGIFLRYTHRLPETADQTVSGLVLQFSVPPVAFLAARTMPISAEMFLPASMGWIVFGAGLLIFGALRRLLRISRETFGCLMLTAALCNTVFIGLPMIQAFFGEKLVYVAFLCDSPGTSLILAVPGVLLAAHLSNRNDSRGTAAKVRNSLRQVFTFPPFQGLVLGLLSRGFALPDWLLAGLSRIGATLVPLALFSVGLGLRFRLPPGMRRPLALGLIFKLILAPLLMLIITLFIYRDTGQVAQVTVFEAAMPPMVLGGILATDYGLEPELAALMVGIGTPLGFLTLPLWHWILSQL